LIHLKYFIIILVDFCIKAVYNDVDGFEFYNKNLLKNYMI